MSPDPPHLTLLERVATTLSRAGIPHAVIGGRALASHGVGRATFDDDLLTVDRRCLDPAIWAPFLATPTKIDIRRGDLFDPLAGVVAFEEEGQKPVDLVVGRGLWQKAILDRAVTSEPSLLPLVRPADLILLKLYAGGPQDSWDIVQLLALPESPLWRQEVESRLAELSDSCTELWRKILSS
ncbi:MAG: hypothetical protein SF066_04930 [Thermoanaerobaculia bacterium]|nr:hypothetical protein [Thermoanaerobaculia bacterium]